MTISVNNFWHEFSPVAGSGFVKNIGAAATSLDALPLGVQYVEMTMSGGAMRYSTDGVDPTSAAGHLIEDGRFQWSRATAAAAKFIALDGATVVLTGTGYRQ